MHKIALTVESPHLDAEVDPRFGRAAIILFIEPETMVCEVKANPGRNARGGAGVRAAQFLGERDATAVISGDFGPKAHRALEAAGIAMYRCDSGTTAREAVELYQAGKLPSAVPIRETDENGIRR